MTTGNGNGDGEKAKTAPVKVESDPRDVPAPYPTTQDFTNRFVNAGLA